jgi:hypothetical protein
VPGVDVPDERPHRVLDRDPVRGEVLGEQVVVADLGGGHGRQRGPAGQRRRGARVLGHAIERGQFPVGEYAE